MNLADVAINLGNNDKIMNSYYAFHKTKQNWFFSPNPHLNQAASKPTSFDKWSSWDRISGKQRMTLAVLAGFHYTAKKIKRNDQDFAKLRKAFLDWPNDLYSVFWSNDDNKKVWLCNVFVGDAIYLFNKRSFTSGNNHYYDPEQILNGKSFLHKRDGFKDVIEGDIVVIGTGHVEIVTRIEKNWVFDDGFCSVGAGRGLSPDRSGGDGTVKCDSDFGRFLPKIGGPREIEDSNNTYFYL